MTGTAGQQTCIDVLCAYLRMPYAVRNAKDSARPRRDERQVRSTVANLIGAHLRDRAKVSWQGRDLDLTGATIDGGDFSEAVFNGGKVSFDHARFTGGLVDFKRARFTGGEVGFFGARFGECFSVRFDDAQFTGGNVVFMEAHLSDGNVTFNRARFTDGRVDFRGVYFDEGFVYFDEAGLPAGSSAISIRGSQAPSSASMACASMVGRSTSAWPSSAAARCTSTGST